MSIELGNSSISFCSSDLIIRKNPTDKNVRNVEFDSSDLCSIFFFIKITKIIAMRNVLHHFTLLFNLNPITGHDYDCFYHSR